MSSTYYLYELVIFQLGITANTPAEFLAKAKEIVLKHKELDVKVGALQKDIQHMEVEQMKLVGVG